MGLLWRRIRGVLFLRRVQLNIYALLICIDIKLFAERLMIFRYNLQLYRALRNWRKMGQSVLVRMHFPMRLPSPSKLRDLVRAEKIENHGCVIYRLIPLVLHCYGHRRLWRGGNQQQRRSECDEQDAKLHLKKLSLSQKLSLNRHLGGANAVLSL